MQLAPLATHRFQTVPLPLDGWRTVGHLQDDALDETSGVAVSRERPGVMWVHNDSGDRARVFGIDASGKLLQEVQVGGALAIDWEDISLGPARDARRSALYVADTGDNLGLRRTSSIYRFDEPAAGVSRARAERITVQYADARPRNVEAMSVDPVTGDIYLISKQAHDGAAEVFRMPKAMVDAGGGRMTCTGTLPDVGPLVTGADISADGRKIAITTYNHVYEWRREPGELVSDALLRRPDRVVDATGAESIAYTPDGHALFSVPEGQGATVYERTDALDADVRGASEWLRLRAGAVR